MPTSRAHVAASRFEQESPHSCALRYQDVRAEIQDGDVLLFDGPHFLSSVVKRLTSGAYSHCGVVLTWNGRRMLVHVDVSRGVQATLLSSAVSTFRGRGLVWLSPTPEARAALDMDALRAEAQAHLGMSYDMWGVVHAGAHVLLGARAPAKREVASPTHCSALVARCFRMAGVPLAELADELVSPDYISRCATLVTRGRLQVTGTVRPTLPPPAQAAESTSLRTRIKLMSFDLVEKASALLPEVLRRRVHGAAQAEQLLHEGQNTLALTEGEGSRYERTLRQAMDNVACRRQQALATVEAFKRGEATLWDALQRVEGWKDAGAQGLWRHLDEVETADPASL